MMKLLFSSSCFVALASFTGSALAAPINVNYSVTPQGGSFAYSFSVNDSSVPNLLSVTLTLPSQVTALTNLAAPSGFSIFYDGGVHLPDFVEDTRTFTLGSTIGPFTFLSPMSLGTIPFSGLSLDSAQNPVTTTGVAVPAVSGVPEPGGLALLSGGLGVLLALLGKRARAGA